MSAGNRRHELYGLETRRAVMMSESAALEMLDSEQSRGYEQPPVADGTPRHLVLNIVMPKSLLRLGMQRMGSLERGQSTSARLMRTVEHFVSVICKCCNLRADPGCDRAADALVCDAFYWTRAELGKLYAYECHCVCLVALSQQSERRFRALFNAACIMFNSRWPLSRRQFPLAVMQRSFAYGGDSHHFARGREPLEREAPQHGYTMRFPVTQHHNEEQPAALDRAYFRDFFHSPMLVSFAEAESANLSVDEWALRVLQPERDLEWRVLVPGGDAFKSDVQQLLDSRVGLTQEQQRGISQVLGIDFPFRAICMETPHFLALFKPPAARVPQPPMAQQSQSLRPPAAAQQNQGLRPPARPRSPSSGAQHSIIISSSGDRSKRSRQTIELDPPSEVVYDSDNESSVEKTQLPVDVGFEPANRAERAFARQVEEQILQDRQRPRSNLRRSNADAQSRSAESAHQLAAQGSTDVRPIARPSVCFTAGTAAAKPQNGFV